MTARRRRSARRTSPNSADMRKLRAALIVRDGNACAYCRVPFTDPGTVTTIDHIAPYCLYRTWRREALVLACHACNQAKADRLPVLLALLILHRHGHPTPDPSPDADRTGATDTAASGPGGVGPDSPGESGVHDGVHGRVPVFTPDMWAVLARIASAVESGTWPDSSADRPGDQSEADQGEHHLVHAVNAPVNNGTHVVNTAGASGPHTRLARRTPTGPRTVSEAA